MVSLRYHLVSLGAALLALAAGVVLGAGPLSTRISEVVNAAPSASGTADPALVKKRLAYDDAYAAETANKIVARTLPGTRVVLVVAPGTPVRMVTDQVAILGRSGAKVTAQVTLTTAWTDPTQTTVLAGITSQLAPPETVVDTSGSSAYGQASAALGAALLTRQPGAAPAASEPAAALLAGLTQGGFLSTSGTPAIRANLAVLITPRTSKVTAVAALLPLGPALDAASAGAVVSGPTGSADAVAVLAAIRRDAAAKAAVSTVDDADVITGRVAVVLALAQQLAGRQGHYGSGSGAVSPVPVIG